jgi:hypothetical protein
MADPTVLTSNVGRTAPARPYSRTSAQARFPSGDDGLRAIDNLEFAVDCWHETQLVEHRRPKVVRSRLTCPTDARSAALTRLAELAGLSQRERRSRV